MTTPKKMLFLNIIFLGNYTGDIQRKTHSSNPKIFVCNLIKELFKIICKVGHSGNTPVTTAL